MSERISYASTESPDVDSEFETIVREFYAEQAEYQEPFGTKEIMIEVPDPLPLSPNSTQQSVSWTTTSKGQKGDDNTWTD